MEPVAAHEAQPDVSFDGGDLDCGNGLLLLIRKHIDPMAPGALLEIRSTEMSVDEDLPAWCRLTGNRLISWTRQGSQRSFLIAKKPAPQAGNPLPPPRTPPAPAGPAAAPARRTRRSGPAPAIPPRAVTAIGSWPRPRWMVSAMHAFTEGRLGEAEFQETADDAVRLAIAAQERAGLDMVTDGEQRRDSYAAFVASRLEGCQLIPLSDLSSMTDHPDEFLADLAELAVPADELRHPAVFGALRRTAPLVAHEVAFALGVTDRPVKVALPGPYVLTRTMWLECLSENAYGSRDEIAADIVRVLREELSELMESGVALVQLDEPVLAEVVFSGSKNRRSFMCGALSESHGPAYELAMARDLVNAVIAGFPRERIGLHVCRGNWTSDETLVLAGSYAPLIETFREMRVGAYLLEMHTPRAGEMALLARLPDDARIGIGLCNQKHAGIEAHDDLVRQVRAATNLLGMERPLFHPDCGFATFCDIPLVSPAIAEAKLRAITEAVQQA
jgi:5-methyltetrahydropteroyltriglutamate--homocysteine methyltransferase